jgi:two-component system alkaline phosphatase synthesis response regulator PhoP
LNKLTSVLVVDDQPELRLLVRLTFGKAGYTVREAADGSAALAACATDVPDVILLDVMMPGIDGYETCRRLREDTRLAGTTIVMMTAGDQAAERGRALESGADLYLPKPFSPQQLRQQVIEHLARREN